jgi:hypothetical protein
VNIDLQCIFNNKDATAWKIFLGDHSFCHSTIGRKVVEIYNLTPIQYPLSNLIDINDWLLRHNDEHKSIAAIIGISTPPDLISVDFSKEDQFYNWMYNHQAIHDQIKQVIGI